MRNSQNLVWLPLTPSFFWISNVNGFKFGTSGRYGNFIDSTFTHEPYPGLFDTASSFIYLPRSNIKRIKLYLYLIEIGIQIISKILRG